MNKELPSGLELVKDLKSFIFSFNQKSAVDCLYVSGALEQIEKKLKVLEIIKENDLYSNIYYNEGENDYRAWGIEPYRSLKLTKEEYDLLKDELYE